MPSFEAKLIMRMLRVQPYSWAKGSLQDQRSRQEKSARLFRIPAGIEYQAFLIQDLPAEWIAATNTERGIILYLHGGAYALGSINSHREYLSRLAVATNRKILAINYRLAPENPFPAALEDTQEAYRWLLSKGYAPSEIVIAGDSAGGGLVISTLISLRDVGESLPACAVCISPWVDLTLSGNSINRNAHNDPMLNAKLLKNYADYYAGDNENNNPLISPLFADLRGLPPLLIHVGDSEILLDDATRLSEKALRAGVDAKVEIWEGLFHVFQIIPYLPETKLSLYHISDFISDHIQRE